METPRSSFATSCGLLLALLVIGSARPCRSSLYHPPQPVTVYHAGAVLDGAVPVSVLYYGAFSPHQKAVIADFILSLSPRSGGIQHQQHHTFGSPGPAPAPSVAQWWETVDRYVRKAGRRDPPRVVLASQAHDAACSLGKTLSRLQVERLAARLGVAPGGVAVVLTAADVAVEGQCISACGAHGATAPGAAAHVWVGNAAAQCPGRCAWPFHPAEVGARHAPGRGGETLGAPNGDVGVDGILVNLAAMLAGAVTNPYGHGFYQGDAGGAAVEVAAACPGVYGRGAYPGYPGAVRTDRVTGAGYNVVGRNGRKYLVPALVDPDNFSCIILS
ncbi:unnamed protein product [Urochloa humidicola]